MLTHYLSVALRNLRASPLASAMNVVTLALGIACFVIAYAFVLFWGTAERQFKDSDRIAVFTMSLSLKGDQFKYEGDTRVPSVAAKYLKEDFPAIEKIARAASFGPNTMIASGERAERAPAAAADPEFLELFELPFVAGDARNALRSPRSVVLTKDFAAKLLGSEPALGRAVRIGNLVDATVTGVIDAIPEPSHMGRSKTASLQFDFLTSYDVLEAIDEIRRPNAARQSENWIESRAFTYARLPADGSFTLSELRAQLPEFTRRHLPADLTEFAQIKHGVINVRDVLKNRANSELFLDNVGLTVSGMLLALGALVLGVACVNYANLSTARAARRTREIGLRKALGAQRGQIAIQSLIEAGLLTAIAVIVALAIVGASMPLLRTLIAANLSPILFAGSRFWLFLVTVIIVVTLAAGAYPALVISSVRPVSALRASRAQLGSKWLSTLMIGSQFAVASFLLIFVAIAALQNEHLVRTGLAARSDPLVMIENPSAITKLDSATLRAELARLPQVKGTSEIAQPPWVSLSGTLMMASPDKGAPTKLIMTQAAGLDFFSVFDIPLIAGRVYSREHGDEAAAEPRTNRRDESVGPRAPQPIVVDRSFVEALGFASPEAAIDQLVYSPGNDPPDASQIIGVVENHRFTFLGMMKTTATMYPLRSSLDYQLVKVSRDDVSGGLAAIDRTWKQLAPSIAVSRRFVDDYFNDAYGSYLVLGRVLTGVALLAFGISLTGLFGMATLLAGRRMREVGVRKAHGATSARMVAMLLTSFSKPVLVANVLVWPLAFIAARQYLDQFQAPIQLTPVPFALSLAITLLIAWLAVGTQTLHAARARPADVLRYE